MARFARIDSQIRANRLILANCFRVPELTPFSANRASAPLKIANRRFEAIRANRLHLMKVGSFQTVPEGHKHRVTTPEKPRKIPRTPAEPRRL